MTQHGIMWMGVMTQRGAMAVGDCECARISLGVFFCFKSLDWLRGAAVCEDAWVCKREGDVFLVEV